jgi:hypothetical protein
MKQIACTKIYEPAKSGKNNEQGMPEIAWVSTIRINLKTAANGTDVG